MPDYSLMAEKEVLAQLKTGLKGLTQAEAAERLKIYGPNKIQEKERIHPLVLLLSQFKSPIVWVLLAAMVISFALGDLIEGIVIGIVVLMMAVLGFVQEYRAEKALEALKKMLSDKTRVLRDGSQIDIDVTELVPGDILILEAGDNIAADARLLEASSLHIQEAALTGESTPVSKNTNILQKSMPVADQKNMVFLGTEVTNGTAMAVVVRTGMTTEFGKIAQMISEVETEPTPLAKKLKHVSKIITIGILFLLIFMFAIGIWRLEQTTSQIFLMAIALAVAAIPEGLPAVVTVGLSLGAARLARKKALIRHLPITEALGSCTVICSDKTGTITQNEMTVKALYVNRTTVEVAGTGYSPEGYFSKKTDFGLLLKIGALCNNAKLFEKDGKWGVVGDPTEGALLVSAKKAGLSNLNEEYPRIHEIPFSSEKKRMTTIHSHKQKKIAYMKGAPEVVLGLCTKILVNGRVERLTREEKSKIMNITEKFAQKAFRVLAFATKEATSKFSETEMIFAGLQGMIDPPRPGVKEAIQQCQNAGIKVVMITGDHLTTAQAIAKEVGITGRAITGEELDEITDLAHDVNEIAVYARVNPVHKLKIIEALKFHKHIVAMTGDGVNDAPALKKADIGIAMGSGTDVAREASSLVLTDDHFATIVRAVEEARTIFDNIQKYLAYLFSGNVSEVLVIFIALIFGLPLPLLALHLLWINLVTDGLPALALSADPSETRTLEGPPRKNKNLFRGVKHYLFVYPLILAVAIIWLFDYFQPQGLVKAQTMAFTTLVISQLAIAISCRSIHKPIFAVNPFANKWLWLAVASSFVLQLILLYVPFFQNLFSLTALTLAELGIAAGIALIGFMYLEIHKFVAYERVG